MVSWRGAMRAGHHIFFNAVFKLLEHVGQRAQSAPCYPIELRHILLDPFIHALSFSILQVPLALTLAVFHSAVRHAEQIDTGACPLRLLAYLHHKACECPVAGHQHLVRHTRRYVRHIAARSSCRVPPSIRSPRISPGPTVRIPITAPRLPGSPAHPGRKRHPRSSHAVLPPRRVRETRALSRAADTP